jgi:hypothetical protein
MDIKLVIYLSCMAYISSIARIKLVTPLQHNISENYSARAKVIRGYTNVGKAFPQGSPPARTRKNSIDEPVGRAMPDLKQLACAF